jgi:hypothetical protein
MIRLLNRIAKLVIVMVLMTVTSSMIWNRFVTDTLYNCTDAVGYDYFHPGDWVHARVAFVSHIVTGRSMSEPDTIKEGWSKADLWSLWISFFVVSLSGQHFVGMEGMDSSQECRTRRSTEWRPRQAVWQFPSHRGGRHR